MRTARRPKLGTRFRSPAFSRPWIAALILACCWVAAGACSVFERPIGSRDDNTVTDAAPPADSLPNDLPPDVIGAAAACDFEVVVNEVDSLTTGSGLDQPFVELLNTSDQAVDVGGLFIAPAQGATPQADVARAIPVGTILAPQAHLYLVTGVIDATAGLQNTGCITGAPTPCLHAAWTLDAAGDIAFLLGRDGSSILCQLRYPGGVDAERAWGRVPDGALTASATVPTPGSINLAVP